MTNKKRIFAIDPNTAGGTHIKMRTGKSEITDERIKTNAVIAIFRSENPQLQKSKALRRNIFLESGHVSGE